MRTRRFPLTGLISFLAALLAALSLLLVPVGCTEGTTSGTESGNAVSLRGRVLDASGDAVPGVVARLAKSGLADTTDAAGRYHVIGEGAGAGGGGAGPVVDSLEFLVGSRKAAALAVERWVDSLPDVRILQRTFSGRFEPAVEGIGKVEAILSLPGPNGGRKDTAEFFHNRGTGEFSGYFFFPVAGKEALYAVVVDVYDFAGVLMGTSDTLEFNGLAGDLALAPFDPRNRRLRVEAFFSDTLGIEVREAAPGDTLRLGARAWPPRYTSVTSWAWDRGDGTFLPTDGSLAFMVPEPHGAEIRLVLRIGTDAGHVAEDTLRVEVISRFEHMLRRPWRTLGRHHGQAFEPFPFPARFDHGLVVHRGRLLALGGLAGPAGWSDTLRDAWSTSDGEAWTRVAADAPSSIRWFTSAVARGDTVWLPGSNARASEVWFSADGATWSLATAAAAYPPRIRPSTAVFRGKLWVVGGLDSLGRPLNDVWASDDGREWTRMAEYRQYFGYPEPAWSSASSLAATPDTLYLLTPGKPGALWGTATGLAWQRLQADSLIAEGERHGAGTGALLGFEGHLLLVGTDGLHAFDLAARAWRSLPNGPPDWAGGMPRAGYERREGAGVAFFRDRVWLTGGWVAVGARGGGIKIHDRVSTLAW